MLRDGVDLLEYAILSDRKLLKASFGSENFRRINIILIIYL